MSPTHAVAWDDSVERRKDFPLSLVNMTPEQRLAFARTLTMDVVPDRCLINTGWVSIEGEGELVRRGDWGAAYMELAQHGYTLVWDGSIAPYSHDYRKIRDMVQVGAALYQPRRMIVTFEKGFDTVTFEYI